MKQFIVGEWIRGQLRGWFCCYVPVEAINDKLTVIGGDCFCWFLYVVINGERLYMSYGWRTNSWSITRLIICLLIISVLQRKCKKNCLDIWWVQTKAVILQPFSRLAQASATRCHEDGNADEYWKSASYKENAEKMTEDLVSPNKSSNFAAAFEQTRPLGVESKKAQ